MIKTKTLPRMLVASKSYQIQDFTTEMIEEISNNFSFSLEKSKSEPSTPSMFFTVFHVNAYRESDYTVELCERVGKRGRERAGICFYELEESEVAFIVTSDDMDALAKHYDALYRYMQDNGITQYDHPREAYIESFSSPSGYLTEISLPFSR